MRQENTESHSERIAGALKRLQQIGDSKDNSSPEPPIEELEFEVDELLTRLKSLAPNFKPEANAEENDITAKQILTDFHVYETLIATLPEPYRRAHLETIKAKAQKFLSTINQLEFEAVEPTLYFGLYTARQLGLITDAEQVFSKDYSRIAAVVDVYQSKLERYSNLDQLTQSDKIERMRELVSILKPCADLGAEYYLVANTLPYADRMEAIAELQTMVAKSMEEIIKAGVI